MFIRNILELPSSLDWCESNYVYNISIAEFWNTITGFSLCITAIYCFIKNKNANRQIYQLLKNTNLLLFIVGIGTVLFHGTLLYIWQLFDEIPMLLILIEYHKLLSRLFSRFYFVKYNKNIYKVIPIIILSYYINPNIQIILFQGIIALYIIYTFYICYYINNELNTLFYYSLPRIENKSKELSGQTYEKFEKYISKKKLLKLYSRIGISILLFSVLIWNIDNNYCKQRGYIELHAVWHISTSIGMYYCNQIMKIYIELYFLLNLKDEC